MLLQAARHSLLQCVQLPQVKSTLPDIRDVRGWTPLHWAAKTGNAAAVDFLLSNGADVLAKDYAGATPLHIATLGPLSSMDLIIHALLHAQHPTPLPRSGRLRSCVADATDQNQQTALHWLAGRHSGSLNCLQQWLSLCVIDAQDIHGNTPLHYAVASCKHFSFISSELIRAGADVTAQNKSGDTIIHTAAGFGRLQSLCTLLDASKLSKLSRRWGLPSTVQISDATRAMLITQNTAGMTPLALAVTLLRWSDAVIQVLQEVAGDPGRQDVTLNSEVVPWLPFLTDISNANA